MGAPAGQPYQPFIWDHINRVWSQQDYVDHHPHAGDATKESAVAWAKVIAWTDEKEKQSLARLRGKRGN